LRIGYVSPDFRRHPVGRFILPLVSNHSRQQFEVFCYSDIAAARVDHITEKLKSCASCWRDTKGLSDAELAELIRRDRIDLLIDLTMHMADNRLRVFAMKPAPVQVTYLAYVGTTGLDTIDYRITDPYLDPRGASSAEPIYSEQSIHLPNSYWCYTPPEEAPAVVDRGDQSITLGCLNLFWKASPSALAAWCRVLHAAPGSRMILHAPEGAPRQRVIELLQTNGIDPQRMQFVGIQPFEEYLKTYQQIDIALDPFPYNGGTTSCDALWMGVPVVSCIGILAVGRAGLSILSNIGLPKLVAGSVDEYVRIAVELANDRPRLSELRAGLRERMLRSPLMDALAFARDMEQAYRTMWRRFCGT
jgi:predicted O-linked N-acetylglucosamine transferase (SPINDLY family)